MQKIIRHNPNATDNPLEVDPATNFTQLNIKDDDGRHSGGTLHGPGFTIFFQAGPVVLANGEQVQNGAFIETVTNALLAQLEYYDAGEYSCKENKESIHHLQKAAVWMKRRRQRRASVAKLGTHAPEQAIR